MNLILVLLSIWCLAVLVAADPKPFNYYGGGNAGRSGQGSYYGGPVSHNNPFSGGRVHGGHGFSIRNLHSHGHSHHHEIPRALIGGLHGPAASDIKTELGGPLGGVLTSVLISGVGGIVSSNPSDGGCRATNVATVIKQLLDALDVEIRPCSSDVECDGVRCVAFPGAPSLGKICKIA